MATATFTPVVSPAGYQGCGFSTKTLATATGLATTTPYYFKVRKDVGALTELSITTASTVTYTAIIALMNTAMGTDAATLGATWSIVGGDLVCTSDTSGPSSRIGLAAGSSGADLFATLTSWAGFGSAVSGAPTYRDETERYVIVQGSLAASAPADTYATGGLVTSFAGISGIPQNSPPVWVDVKSLGPCSTASTLSNIFTFIPGTTVANGKTMILVTNGAATGIQALQENTNSLALNDAKVYVNLDRIVFRATFRKGA